MQIFHRVVLYIEHLIKNFKSYQQTIGYTIESFWVTLLPGNKGNNTTATLYRFK